MNLGLPSFGQLIERLAEELDFDPELFSLAGDYMSLAEYYMLVKGKIGPLRSWMDNKWHSESVDISESRIHQAITELNFPVIYTTNYDRWIERSFDHWRKSYHKITNVSDLASAGEGTQIVKFHGDFDDDNSIILSESTFFERMSFESPLDIKLRSDILGKSVLFIGYSLTDINLRYLMFRLQKQWEREGYVESRPNSYIFLTQPSIVQERILRSRGIEPIIAGTDDPKTALSEFLTDLMAEAYGKSLPVV
ncbi:Sir2 family NAD-dependent protein deacetylase [Rhodococcus hoagii]|nr:Sir2 family NAD-dependent protein deacetylase [Prescottella equi]